MLGPAPRMFVSMWEGALESIFLTYSQVMLMLQVPGLHLEDHSLRGFCFQCGGPPRYLRGVLEEIVVTGL